MIVHMFANMRVVTNLISKTSIYNNISKDLIPTNDHFTVTGKVAARVS